MSPTTEAFARVKIDALLKDAGWDLADGTSVLFEYTLTDGTRSDYVCDRAGRPMAALEAKHAGIDPVAAQDQGRHYAAELKVPFEAYPLRPCRPDSGNSSFPHCIAAQKFA